MRQVDMVFMMVGLIVCALTLQTAEAVEPCNEASGVLGGFPRALCLYDTAVGAIGGPVNISVPETMVTVPNNPDGTDDVDVFVLLANEIAGPPAMDYTTTFSWGTPVDPSGLIFREWVGNFGFDPPRAIPLAYVNAPENEIKPAEFEWVLNNDGLATGARVGTGPGTDLSGWRNLQGLPPELPSVERYHFKIAGLDAGTEVIFTKNVVGGQVVPEPSSLALVGFGLLGLTCCRRRRTAG